ncbi:hypothetical protein C8Q76DRAFT_704696 [Earliella scabrosa]|nr:hypothetical protein C8Q76DRAFT_704696 [Earliella scabrosa]
MQSSRTHHRARSAGALSPASESPSSRARPSHRSTASVPELPALQLPPEGLGFPGIPSSPTRIAAARNAPPLPPLNLPAQALHVPGVNNPHLDWDVPLFDDRREGHTTPRTNEDQEQRQPTAGLMNTTLEVLGYIGQDARARRALLSFVFSMIWWFAQFVIVITLLAYSGSHESPTTPGVSEWDACDRPLGVWNALWLLKVMLSASLSMWNWKRERIGAMARRQQARPEQADAELGTQRGLNGQTQFAPPPASRNNTARRQSRSDNRHQLPPQTRLHARVSIFTSFLTLTWFLTAHVLEYTTVHSCRFAAPHLWWLTFGILCTLYLMILEIFLLGLLVFILGPVLFLIYNILLLCLGRHPLQNPHYIKPDVGKLPKSVVDQIPLVLYIPPPPDTDADAEGAGPIAVPPAAHSYPPTSPKSPAPSAVPKRRFAFFRRKKAGAKKAKGGKDKGQGSSGDKDKDKDRERERDGDEGEESGEEEVEVPWDEMWEKGEYPFVRLEGNRAVCAICLMDFEEPRRARGRRARGAPKVKEEDANANAKSDGEGEDGAPVPEREAERVEGTAGTERTAEIQVEEVTEEERDALKLNDAGEGAQPLRLLSCGHVFHKTCLDPWLTDVSGRCPICQRPVEIPQPSKKGKRRRRS